eukprot:1150904-Pelagomonas_calceolata.AAC.4
MARPGCDALLAPVLRQFSVQQCRVRVHDRRGRQVQQEGVATATGSGERTGVLRSSRAANVHQQCVYMCVCARACLTGKRRIYLLSKFNCNATCPVLWLLSCSGVDLPGHALKVISYLHTLLRRCLGVAAVKCKQARRLGPSCLCLRFRRCPGGL